MDKSKRLEKAYDFAAELVKQLITLSVGIVTVTVTFAKDIFASSGHVHSSLLFGGWIVHLVAILFGMLAFMGFTGSLEKSQTDGIYESRGRIYLGVQVTLFLAGTVLVVIAGVMSAR